MVLTEEQKADIRAELAEIKKPWECESRPDHKAFIRFYCELSSVVWDAVIDPGYGNDCFCGEGGYWPNEEHPNREYDGTPGNGFRRSGETEKYIYNLIRDHLLGEGGI